MSYIRRDLLKAGLALSAGSLITTSSSALTSSGAAGKARLGTGSAEPFQPTWNSLRNWRTPAWLRDGKFGIYTHWGVYSVPAVGPNGTWYSHHVYMNPNSPERVHQEATYGALEKFGYKDFIPMFTGREVQRRRMGGPVPKVGRALCRARGRTSRWILDVGYEVLGVERGEDGAQAGCGR